MSVIRVFLPVLAGCGSAPPPEPVAPSPAGPPSILLVVMDTVRADHTSVGGAPPSRMPQLHALAQAGTTWTAAHSTSCWTWPAHASLFTGLHPWEHGAHAAPPGEGLVLRETLTVTPMDPAVPTLAERLVAAGYEARATVANRLLAAPLGLTRGFTEVLYEDSDDAVVAAATAQMRADGPPQLLFVNLMQAHSPSHVLPGSPVDEARIAAQPWTAPYRIPGGLSLHTTTPSGVVRHLQGDPAIPPEGLALLDALYSAELVGVDRSLNRLLQAWTAAHPDGVVLVTSDHGEAMGEHGLLQHVSSTYAEVTQVPLVLAGPGIPAGVRDDTPVSLIDVMPTLLELAGVAPAEHSLARPESMPDERDILAAAWPSPHLAQAVGGRLAQHWRLLRRGGEAVVTVGEDVELYSVLEDPGMVRDRAADQPERARELADRVRAQVPMAAVEGGIPASPELVEQLQALGYMD